MSDKKPPIIQLKDRTLSVSIFEREITDLSTGKTSRSYGACVQRSFKKKDTDTWEREQINMFPEELLKMSALYLKAYNQLTDHVNKIKQESKGNSDYPSSNMSLDDNPPAQTELDDDIPF